MRAKAGKKDETWYRNERVIPCMRSWLIDVQHHEDRLVPDIPDLSYGYHLTNGWIELKFSEEFPKKQTTKFNPPDFTPGQRSWLHRRAQMGGAENYLLWGSLKEHVLVASWSLGRAADMTWAEIRAIKNDFNVIVAPDVNDIFKILVRRWK